MDAQTHSQLAEFQSGWSVTQTVFFSAPVTEKNMKLDTVPYLCNVSCYQRSKYAKKPTPLASSSVGKMSHYLVVMQLYGLFSIVNYWEPMTAQYQKDDELQASENVRQTKVGCSCPENNLLAL